MTGSRRLAAATAWERGEMTVCRVIEDDAGVELRVAGDWIGAVDS